MLKAHFLNVGKGNCTVIEFPSGRLSMIDIDNSRTDNDEDLTDPIDYYKNKFSNQSLFRFILTHPDMDHMSGLNKLSQIITFQNFWDTEHNKKMNSDDWENSPYDKNDWEKYLEFRQSTKNPQCLQLYQGATSECCWTQDGITIFSPTKKLVDLANDKEEYNHLSYVIKLQYNGVKVLFGGDATVEAWDEIHENYNDEDLQADIFLAPHHGSKNNVNDEVFNLINPDHVIVSVAEGVDYDYDYYGKLARKKVLSTKYYGTMMLEIDNSGKYTIYVERNAD